MIRLMTSKDSVHVQQIARKTWSTTYNDILPEKTQKDFIEKSYSTAMLLKRMEKTNVLIIECDDQPIGFANFTYRDEDGDSELTDMYILPAYQKSGHGANLFSAILAMLQDARQLAVYVDFHNTIGRSFYEKQGFELVDVFEEYFEGYPVETVQYVYPIQQPALV